MLKSAYKISSSSSYCDSVHVCIVNNNNDEKL